MKIDAETNEIVDVIPVGRDTGSGRASSGSTCSSRARTTRRLPRIDGGHGRGHDVRCIRRRPAASRPRASGSSGRSSLQPRPRLARRRGQHAPRSTAFVTAARSRIRLRRRRWGLAVGLLQSVALGDRPVRPAHSPDSSVATSSPPAGSRRLSSSRTDSGAAWVPLGFGNALLRIDASLRRRGGRYASVATPSDPAVGFGSIWVPTFGDDNVWRFDAVVRAPPRLSSTSVTGPFGVAVGAGSVWVANNCDGTVSRIDPATQ